MKLNKQQAKHIALEICQNEDEKSLVPSFIEVCSFIAEFPSELSWRSSPKPDIKTVKGLTALATRYFHAYRRSDFPVEPSTIPDEMVSIIMEKAYGYTSDECQKIKLEHQRSMCAENCVGNLLERYFDSKLRESNWSWCCGEFVKAIDFLGKNENKEWIALQIKNRDNSENSSSSAIRDGTRIQKWFRSFSKDTKKGRNSFTNWDKLPTLMQGYNLNESDFKIFVNNYIESEKKIDQRFNNFY